MSATTTIEFILYLAGDVYVWRCLCSRAGARRQRRSQGVRRSDVAARPSSRLPQSRFWTSEAQPVDVNAMLEPQFQAYMNRGDARRQNYRNLFHGMMSRTPSPLDALSGAGVSQGLGGSPRVGAICLGTARGAEDAWGGARGRGPQIA